MCCTCHSLLPGPSGQSKESESLAGTLKRTLSILFDCGAESAVYRSPSSFIEESLPSDNIFPLALPIPDHDHSLHHVSWCSICYFCLFRREGGLWFELLTNITIQVTLSNPEAAKVMECLEDSFKWAEYFQPRLHSLSLFFSNISRCNRFSKICIQQNPKIPEPCNCLLIVLFFFGVVVVLVTQL